MDRLRFLASAALLLSAFLWTNCADAERPPQAPPVRALECECPSCSCGDSCLCLRAVCDGPAKCECPTCKDRLQVQPFGNSEELPVRLALITTTDGNCPGCVLIEPAWLATVAAHPDICETIDAHASAEYVRSLGIRQWPTLVLLEGDRTLYPPWPSKVYARNQLEWMATFAEGVRERTEGRAAK